MVLPRFRRLATDEQARILAVAAEQFAERGTSTASLIDIAEAAGLSRSAMYNYFDGRDDLLDAVRADALTQVVAVLGDWHPTDSVEDFWRAFLEGSERLAGLLADRPALRAVLAGAHASAPADWLSALVDNAVQLGLVPREERGVALGLTEAVLEARDQIEILEPGRLSAGRVRSLLTALWGALGSDGEPGGRGE